MIHEKGGRWCDALPRLYLFSKVTKWANINFQALMGERKKVSSINHQFEEVQSTTFAAFGFIFDISSFNFSSFMTCTMPSLKYSFWKYQFAVIMIDNRHLLLYSLCLFLFFFDSREKNLINKIWGKTNKRNGTEWQEGGRRGGCTYTGQWFELKMMRQNKRNISLHSSSLPQDYFHNNKKIVLESQRTSPFSYESFWECSRFARW